MNYNSIDKIFAAGTTNMEVIRDNSELTTQYDTIAGVDWFNFNDTVASNVYVSGSSWIGFGSASEHLKVSRNNCAMYYLYREEGTLYHHYKFLKIRYVGFSWVFGTSSNSYVLIYDVILWDTGDISLHMISIPTSQPGQYSLTTSSKNYWYTVTTSSPDVTFVKTDSGFEVQNNIIALTDPWEHRYLIRDDSNIYTVVDNALSLLGAVSVSSDLFLNSGVEDMPAMSLMNGLTNPELLYWNDMPSSTTHLSITGTPPLPQVVIYEDITVSETQELNIIEADASIDALFTVTFDGGTTWNYFHNGVWITSNSIIEGMTKATLNALTHSLWQDIMAYGTCQVRCVLPSIASYIKTLMVGYAK